MAETFYNLHNRLRAEIGDYFPVPMAKLYVQRAMRTLSEKCRWSWLLRSEQIQVPAAITGKYVTVTPGSKEVVADAALATAINALVEAPIGRRQLQIGTGGGNLFEIRNWDSGTNTLLLNAPVPYTLSAGSHPCTVYKFLFLPPSMEQSGVSAPAESPNFSHYLVVRDKSNNFPLILDHSSAWIDKRDPRRDSTGTPTHFLEYPTTTSLFPGSGNDPGQIPPGTPRHELWPHPTGAYTYDALYQLRWWDLADDRSSTLPETLNPDLVLNMALANAYRWAMARPQNFTTKVQIAAMSALMNDARNVAIELYLDAYREDKLIYPAREKDLLGGKFPYVMGAAYAQVHDINLMSGLYSD